MFFSIWIYCTHRPSFTAHLKNNLFIFQLHHKYSIRFTNGNDLGKFKTPMFLFTSRVCLVVFYSCLLNYCPLLNHTFSTYYCTILLKISLPLTYFVILSIIYIFLLNMRIAIANSWIYWQLLTLYLNSVSFCLIFYLSNEFSSISKFPTLLCVQRNWHIVNMLSNIQ